MRHFNLSLAACLLAAMVFLPLGGCMTVSAQPVDPAWQDVSTGAVYKVADRFGAGDLDYRVHWDSLALDETEGHAATTISGTAYVLACGCDTTRRSVAFLFNGGPGASSSPLHFALGPHAREKETGTFPDNDGTVLRAADLVFIDPVETGYSRAASPEGTSRYLGVTGDVEAVSAFIHRWLAANGRVGAPVILVGQSYGGFRLANLLPDVSDLDIRGLIMVSPMLNPGASGSDLGNVFALPTMAATAWRFGKSSSGAASEAEAWEAAREFSETDYLLALQQGDLLAPEDKQRLAARIAAMTGLPENLVLQSDLRVDIQDFLETLLAGDGLLVSRLNTAKTDEVKPAPANPDRPAAANDPSLGLGHSNKIVSPDIAAYLQSVTGLDRGDDYRSLNLDANFAWDWSMENRQRFYVDATPLVAQFMTGHPDVHLLVFGGYRDLATPLLGTRYALAHGGLPQARTELVMLPSGHSPFDEPELKTPFSDDIYKFIREAAPASDAGGAAAQ